MVRLKNFSIVVVFFTLLSSLLTAQNFIGIRGGLNFAWYNERGVEFYGLGKNYSENSKVLTGSAFAGILEIGVSKYFALQPELVIIQKGWGGDSNVEKSVVNCFDFPLLAKLKINERYFNVYAVFGPTFGYALSALNSKKNWEEEWGDYNRFQLSLSMGGGLGLNLKKGIVFMDVRHLRGLNSLKKTSTLPPYTYQDQRATSLTFGYLYRLGE